MNKIAIWVLICLLSAGLFLRVYKLSERGVFNYDEAYYLLQGQFVFSAVQNFPSIYISLREGKTLREIYDKYIEGTFLSTPKILVPPTIALAGLFTGGVKDYTANYVSVVFNILTLFLTVVVIFKYFGVDLALLVAAMLGSLEYDIIYARSSYPESVPGFLFVLSVFVFFVWKKSDFKNKKKYIYSVLMALMLTYNYRYIVAIAVFMLVAIVEAKKNKWEVKQLIIIISSPIIAFICLALIFESPYFFLRISGKLPNQTTDALGGNIAILSYFQMLSKWFGAKAVDKVSSFSFSFYHIKNLWSFVGPLAISCFVLTLILFKKITNRYYFKYYLLSITILTLFVFSYSGLSGRPRAIAYSMPFFAIFCSMGLQYTLDKIKSKYKIKTNQLLYPSIAIIIFIIGALRSSDSLLLKSNFKEAYLQLEEFSDLETKHFTTIWPMSSFYMGRNRSLYPIPSDLEQLKKHYANGVEYLVVDGNYSFVIPDNIETKIQQIEPVIRVNNSDALHISNLGRRKCEILERLNQNPELNNVRIYSLADILDIAAEKRN